jgi:hypothetical protein
MAIIALGFLASLLTVFTFCRLVTCRLAEGSIAPGDWSARKQAQRRLMDELSRIA